MPTHRNADLQHRLVEFHDRPRAGRHGLGVHLRGLTGGERRYDIGNFDAYFQAFVEFALADPRHGEALRRHLEVLLHVPHA